MLPVRIRMLRQIHRLPQIQWLIIITPIQADHPHPEEVEDQRQHVIQENVRWENAH